MVKEKKTSDSKTSSKAEVKKTLPTSKEPEITVAVEKKKRVKVEGTAAPAKSRRAPAKSADAGGEAAPAEKKPRARKKISAEESKKASSVEEAKTPPKEHTPAKAKVETPSAPKPAPKAAAPSVAKPVAPALPKHAPAKAKGAKDQITAEPVQKTVPQVAPVAPPTPPAPVVEAPSRQKLRVNESVTVKDLAEKMNVKVPDMIKKLMSLGKLVNINQRLDTNTASLVAEAFNFELEVVPLYADEALSVPEDVSQLVTRPPVVTVMGHVDHGKTSLLDAIREARVAEGEAGGITQHIGAYQVQTAKGMISFLDTPGHEAFTAMRARGAQVTDLVVLVVAADDGVMPQTVEAIDHARAAEVPIVVAINKCDLPTANPQKIKQELANLNLLAEDWGGKTVMVEVSARQKQNIDKLLEMILLEAELLELKANPNRPAQATVVEARLDPKRGPVATLLVQKGTLRVGDAFVCGVTAGKVRALTGERGQRVKEALPSSPVEILGLSGTPETGDKLMVVGSEREAREIAERRRTIAVGEAQTGRRQHLTLEDLHDQAAAGKIKSLPIILKADVQGSLEAVRDSLEKLPSEQIALQIIHSGVGGITTSDVVLADASDAVILGFNVRPDPSSEELARHEGVEVKTYRIIYEMLNDVKKALEGLLEPLEQEATIGWADVRKVFRTPKVPAIAGCYVTSGKLLRTAKVRLVRDGAIIFDGALDSLKRFKDDVREVEKGFECGVALAGFQDVKVGDRFEFYIIEKKARRL